jgi:uncharacterized oxidoreductase
MKMSGNTILITGGATGIGLAMAEGFLQRNNRVAICGRRQDKLDEACRKLPGLRAYCCDVADAGQREELHAALLRDDFSPNVLVNNAAVMNYYDLSAGTPGHLNNPGNPAPFDMARVATDVATNLLAPIALNQMFLPLLTRHSDPVIINVTSPAGLVPIWHVPIYSASKAALNSYTRSLRYQLQGRVEVIELYPPTVDTEMTTQESLHKISLAAFTREMFQRLEQGGPAIWVGGGRYLKWIYRISPALAYWVVCKAVAGEA